MPGCSLPGMHARYCSAPLPGRPGKRHTQLVQRVGIVAAREMVRVGWVDHEAAGPGHRCQPAGWAYLIVWGHVVKVGRSCDVDARLRAHYGREGQPLLVLTAAVPDQFAAERDQMDYARQRGWAPARPREWYAPAAAPDLVAHFRVAFPSGTSREDSRQKGLTPLASRRIVRP